MIKDEVYTIDIFTENGKHYVSINAEGDVEYIKEFKTRTELNKIIGDFIADYDEREEW